MVVGVAAPFHRTAPAPLPKRTSVMLAPPSIAPLRLVAETLLVSTARLPRKLLKSPLRLAAAPLSSNARYEPAGPGNAPLNPALAGSARGQPPREIPGLGPVVVA